MGGCAGGAVFDSRGSGGDEACIRGRRRDAGSREVGGVGVATVMETLAVVARRQAQSRTWTTTTGREEEDTDERSS